MTPLVLRSGAVVLRPLTTADAEALFVAHGDPEVRHFWSDPASASVAETRDKIAEWLERDNVESWAISENDGPALGRLTLMHHRDGVAEIGVILRRDAQGRGLAGERCGGSRLTASVKAVCTACSRTPIRTTQPASPSLNALVSCARGYCAVIGNASGGARQRHSR